MLDEAPVIVELRDAHAKATAASVARETAALLEQRAWQRFEACLGSAEARVARYRWPDDLLEVRRAYTQRQLAGLTVPWTLARAPAKAAQHASDCAVHNPPAYPAGKCDCGEPEERSSVAGNPRYIRITQRQKAAADRLGIPLDVYARVVAEEEAHGL